jgi:hypothetical protein
MVVPAAMAELCPQCGADVRASGSRCKSCGFWLPAAPAPRTGPPQPRPMPPKDNSKRNVALVLTGGGVVVVGLLLAGALVRQRDAAAVASAAPVASVAPVKSEQAVRIEPGVLLAEARRKASTWHQDAVLVSLTATGLDAAGVSPSGSVELIYARPAGQRISGGAEASAERLILRSSTAGLAQSEERTGKSRIAPEPNCTFEDAWAAAQRAGAVTSAGLRLRYHWSDKHARPVWELVGGEGEMLRRLDGVSCSILTR